MFELLLCSELGSSAPALSNGEDSGCFPAGPAPQKHPSHSAGPGGVGMLCCKVPWGAGINLGGKISLLSPQLWGLSLLPVDPAGDAAAPLRNMESEKLPQIPRYPGSRPRQAQQSAPLPTSPRSSLRQGWRCIPHPCRGDVFPAWPCATPGAAPQSFLPRCHGSPCIIYHPLPACQIIHFPRGPFPWLSNQSFLAPYKH